MKIEKIRLKNFIGLYDGCGLKEVEINFDNSNENPFTFLSGGNGSGKSSILTQLHPFKDNFDGRSGYTFGEAEKEIVIRDNQNNIFEITHTYGSVPRSFIKKNGELLNESGSVKECEALIISELKITKDFASIGFLTNSTDSFIKFKTTDRKRYIARLIPELEEYEKIFKTVNQKARDIKNELAAAETELKKNQSIFKEEELENLENQKTILGEKIDETNAKIGSLNEKVNNNNKQLSKNDYGLLVNEENTLKSKIEILTETGRAFKEEFNRKLELDEVENYIKMFTDKVNEHNKDIAVLNSEIKSKEENKNELTMEVSDIDIKLTKLKDIDTELIYKELEQLKLANANINRDTELFKLFENREISIGDLQNVKSFILFLTANYHNAEEELRQVEANGKAYIEENIKQNNILLVNKTKEIETLNNVINTDELHYKEYLKTHKEEDGKVCENPNCPFMLKIKEYELLGEKIEKNKISLNQMKVEKEKIEDEIAFLRRRESTASHFNSLYKNISENKLWGLFNKKCSIFSSSVILTQAINDFEREVQIEDANVKLYSSNYTKIEKFERTLSASKESAKLIETYTNTKVEKQTKIEKVTEELIIKKEQLKYNEQELLTVKQRKEKYETYKDGLINYHDFRNKLKEIEETKNNYNKLVDENVSLNEELKILNRELTSDKAYLKQVEENIITKKTIRGVIEKIQSDINNIVQRREEIEAVKKAVDPAKGIPILYSKVYLKRIEDIANKLLRMAFDDEMAIQFEITPNDFFIIVHSNQGVTKEDVSSCSSGQQSLISLAISLALLQSRIGNYNIIALDEIDGVLDTKNRKSFINILISQLTILGIEQCFVISHNRNFDDVEADIILLKNSDRDENFLNRKNIIWDFENHLKEVENDERI